MTRVEATAVSDARVTLFSDSLGDLRSRSATGDPGDECKGYITDQGGSLVLPVGSEELPTEGDFGQ
jgi:hypothetical protein